KTLAYGEMIPIPNERQGRARLELVLLDLATGKELRRGSPANGSGPGVFSPDGKFLDLGLSPKPVVWDVGRWKECLALELPEGHRYGKVLVFSPDGKRIAGLCGPESGEYDLVLWDAATGKCRSVVEKGKKKDEQPRQGGFQYRVTFESEAAEAYFAA